MPPVEIDYTPKGSDIKIQGMKTCQYPLTLTHYRHSIWVRRQDWLLHRYYCHSHHRWCLWQRSASPSGEIVSCLSLDLRYFCWTYPSSWIQGADLLAYGGESSHQYQVFVPDFLQGQYANAAWFPPDTEEKQQALGAYFGGHANFGKAKEKIPAVIKDIEQETKGTITKWAVVGLCWGGKVRQILYSTKS